jgi:hypothetical protein
MNIAAELLAPAEAARLRTMSRISTSSAARPAVPQRFFSGRLRTGGSVVAMIAGDHEAALRVERELPGTGGCNSNPNVDTAGGCCAPGSQGAADRGSSPLNWPAIVVRTPQLQAPT